MDLAWCSAHGSIAQNTAINQYWTPSLGAPTEMSCMPASQKASERPPSGSHRWRASHSPAESGSAWCSLRPQLAGAGTPFPWKRDALLKTLRNSVPLRCSSESRHGRPSGSRCGTSGRARSDRWRRWAPPGARVWRWPSLPGAGEGRARGAGRSRAYSTYWMAAQVAAGEAPILRLAPGAGPEAAGLVELEEEDEDEEVAAARRVRSFAQDARVRFVGCRLEQLLGLPEEKWSQHLESEDNRQVLGEFLESPSPACCLLFSVTTEGQLEASQQVSGEGIRPHLASSLTDTRTGLASRAFLGSFGTCIRAL